MDMTDKQRLVQFKNGNYTVIFDTETGSKMRVTEDDKFIADFPESMDIKICNRCDLNCPQCVARRNSCRRQFIVEVFTPRQTGI